jgi:hypothetical protein
MFGYFLEVFVLKDDNVFMITRAELMMRGIGVYCDTRDASNWEKKKRVYRDLGVVDFFDKRKKYYLERAGYELFEAVKDSQADTDDLLFRISAGVQDEQSELTTGPNMHRRSEFAATQDAEMDPIKDLTWIYNNIAVMDVKPSDAPSPGAYAHLKFIQENDNNRVDFFTKVYPRIIPSKSQVENMRKNYDDDRDLTDLLERLLEEGKDGSGDVPVL